METILQYENNSFIDKKLNQSLLCINMTHEIVVPLIKKSNK